MLLIGLFFIYLAIAKEFEPMLLIPIGFGILIGNIPFNMDAGLKVGIYEEGSVLNILYQGVTSGWYPPLIFLGIGAMTDFSAGDPQAVRRQGDACRTSGADQEGHQRQQGGLRRGAGTAAREARRD